MVETVRSKGIGRAQKILHLAIRPRGQSRNNYPKGNHNPPYGSDINDTDNPMGFYYKFPIVLCVCYLAHISDMNGFYGRQLYPNFPPI